MSQLDELQKEKCSKFNADYEPVDLDLMLGISKNFFSRMLPLNGLRHPQQVQSCGWFLWAGEQFSDAPDFFEVWHVRHLVERHSHIAPYLGLAPGWRFLVAGEY